MKLNQEYVQMILSIKSNPCPSTGRGGGACPGYQGDHRRPLAGRGADHRSNMQLLTVDQHKLKTRYE